MASRGQVPGFSSFMSVSVSTRVKCSNVVSHGKIVFKNSGSFCCRQIPDLMLVILSLSLQVLDKQITVCYAHLSNLKNSFVWLHGLHSYSLSIFFLIVCMQFCFSPLSHTCILFLAWRLSFFMEQFFLLCCLLPLGRINFI